MEAEMTSTMIWSLERDALFGARTFCFRAREANLSPRTVYCQAFIVAAIEVNGNIEMNFKDFGEEKKQKYQRWVYLKLGIGRTGWLSDTFWSYRIAKYVKTKHWHWLVNRGTLIAPCAFLYLCITQWLGRGSCSKIDNGRRHQDNPQLGPQPLDPWKTRDNAWPAIISASWFNFHLLFVSIIHHWKGSL